MNKIERIITILLFSTLIVSSSCQGKCDRSDEVNSGEIIIKYDIAWNCNNTHNACIRNAQEFEDYAEFNNCGTEAEPELPYIDFSQNSVLIYNIVESGCCIFNRNVSIDTVIKTVTYEIEHVSCGCGGIVAMDIWTIDNNMVLVPKIPDDYTINFKRN